MIKIRIIGKKEVPDDLFEKVDQTFGFALDRYQHLTREAEIVFTDINGPKGGIDKRCTAHLRLFPRGLLVVRSEGEDFFEAANITCKKLTYALEKRICKKKDRNRITSKKTMLLNDNLNIN